MDEKDTKAKDFFEDLLSLIDQYNYTREEVEEILGINEIKTKNEV
jgi:hypothetical protein